MEPVLNILMVGLLKRIQSILKQSLLLICLFIIMNIPNKIHTSKVTDKSAKDVSLAIGKIAITAVYIPAIIANNIIFFHDKSISPNIFFYFFHSLISFKI